MLFPIIMSPQCRGHTLFNSWWKGLQHFSKSGRASFSFKVLATGKYRPDSRYGRTENRRIPLTTQTEGKMKDSLSSKTTIRHEISDEINISNVDVYNSEITEIETIEYYDIRKEIAENKELARLITFIVFDIETTGFSRVKERIIEIALRDLVGGENSSFQTLVNPGCSVPNQHIHGISTKMVSKPGVPRMEELIPILLQYVRSRQRPGGYVVWVAHNARSFDIPFLVNEFSRCSYSIPSNWLFLDTMPLARKAMKYEGSKAAPNLTLPVLGQHYKLPLFTAHRAMADVNLLALVFRRLTIDLKLTVPDLVGGHSACFSEIGNTKKKNLS